MVIRKTFGQQIADELRSLIRTDYRPGDRLPSVEELAARYKVSVIPVREGLLALAHEGLVYRKRRWGTFVAEPSSDARYVAIFSEYDSSQPNSSYYFRRLPQVLRRFLLERGVSSRPYVGLYQEDTSIKMPTPACVEFFQDLEADRLGGVIILNCDWRTQPQLLTAISEKRLPHVPPNFLQMDYARLRADGLQRLRELGCRRVAVLGNLVVPWGTEPSPDIIAREFAAAGLAHYPEWCRGDVAPKLPGAGWEMFREIWAARREKPDGLLVTDDVLFNDASKAVLALRIAVPGKLHVVTHSNKGSGFFYPFPADRLEIDPDACAEAYGRRMLELLHGKASKGDCVMIKARLIKAEEIDDGGDAGRNKADCSRQQSAAAGSSRRK